MLSYHNDLAIKNKYIERVLAHQKADEIVKGIYWERGRGCAVGCTVHSSDHGAYETELGIPIILARLEDNIFEGLPSKRAKIWPLQFLETIKVGVDLSQVWRKFAVWLLTDKKHGVIQYAENEKQKKVIKDVSDAYSQYQKVTANEWQNLRNAAAAAANAAAATGAANAAYAAAATGAANAAAAAAHAANAADYSAAAYSAAAAAGADYFATAVAYAAAQEQARIYQADKLLELLRDCK